MIKSFTITLLASLALHAATYNIKDAKDMAGVISEIEFSNDKEIKLVFEKGAYDFSSLKQKTFQLKKKCSSKEACSIELIGATQNADDTVITSDYPLLMLNGFNNIKFSNMAFNNTNIFYKHGYRSGLTKEKLPFEWLIGLQGKHVEFSNINIKNNKLLLEFYGSGFVSANQIQLINLDTEDFVYKKGVISNNDVLSGSVLDQDVYASKLHLEGVIVKDNKVGYGDDKYYGFAPQAVFNGISKANIYNSEFYNNISYTKGTCFSNSGSISSYNSIYDGNKVLAKKKNATRKNPIPPIGLFGVLARLAYDDGSRPEAEGALFQCYSLFLKGNKITNNYSQGSGILSNLLTKFIGIDNYIANNTAKLGAVISDGSSKYFISINNTFKNNDGVGLPVLLQVENAFFLNTIIDNGDTSLAYRYKDDGIAYYINNALNTERLPETARDYRIKNVAIKDANTAFNYPLNNEKVLNAIKKILDSTGSAGYGTFDSIIALEANSANCLANNTTMTIGSQIK